MNNETLLEKQFDTAFAAPDGIQKLRELILTLAMQGKLVPQDPKDEPASELLKAIELEKKRLVKEGKIKQPKPLPEIKPDEVPYQVPKGWKWVKLGECTNIIMGQSPDSKSYNENVQGLPFFQGKSEYGEIYPIPRKWCTLPLKIAPINSVLISVRAPVGPTNICNIVACIGRGLSAIQGLANTPEFFLLYYFRAFEKHIASFGTGSTFSAITLKVLENLLVPLPPLAEQRRIVAKIEQLMARCDELEKLRNDRSQKLITVHTAAIDRLLTAQNSNDFGTAWQFITQHFSQLYSVKETVTELRKTILQLAVMGKLVPQDPNDEPASELLKAIELEKQQLVKEGKIKQSKPLPEISHDQVPYQLPLSWRWVRLGNITTLQNGFAFKSENYVSQGVKLIRNVNIGHGSIDNKNIAYYPNFEWKKFKDFELSQGDILISLDRPIISTGLKIAVLKENDVPSLLVQRVGRIEVNLLRINPSFLFNWFNSSLFIDRITPGRSNGVPHISTKEVETLLFPLPPLAEQHRIVAKVDRLMALCDRLEETIAATQTKQTDLLNAVMAQV